MSKATCHPDRPARTNGLCKSCYNGQWKPTKEQNQKRNSTPAAKARKLKWVQERGLSCVHRLARYGLTQEDYDALLQRQNNACKICLTPFKNQRPCIDHDHNTGLVRGILCITCNAGIGMLKESGFNLARAAAYLGLQTQWKDYKFVDLK